MPIKIRKVTKNDLAAVLALVNELAIYEKQPEAVTATLEDYQENFEAGVFDILVATFDEKVVGMALYCTTWSTWKGRMLYLEDFIVTNQHRQQGIGNLLFDQLIETAKQLKAKRIKWQVLEWNTPAIRFYEKYPTVFDKEWINGDLYLDV